MPWQKLLRSIRKKQVLPILGPGLSLIEDQGRLVPIRDWLAPRLAKELGVELKDEPPSLNNVACQHLIRGGGPDDLYDEIRQLVDGLIQRETPIPPPLRDLASIRDFDLFLTSSFDPFLGLALENERPGFQPADGILEFHPQNPVDLPASIPDSFVYHILGSVDTYPDFGVWEEDYVEFTCGLLQAPKDTLRHLFRQLRSRSLLLIGAPFSDWIVRFFLRIAKNRRLSEQGRGSQDYLAENPEKLCEPMVFFFDKVLQYPRMIAARPEEFTAELAEKWSSGGQGSELEQILASIPEEPESGSIFISYSRDDQEIALRLAGGLKAAGLPVWLDTKRIVGGTDWKVHLQRAVKTRSSLFLSLISEATEKDDPESRNRFVHQERQWAAELFIPGHIFYQPVVITENNFSPKNEPAVFKPINRHHLPDGAVNPGFIQLMRKWVGEWKINREIRDV